MAMICSICSHPDVKLINRQIVSSGNLSQIARTYKVGYDSLRRHRDSHVGPAALRGVRRSDENHGVRLLEDLDDLVGSSRRILRKAEESGHSKTALLAIKETRSSISTIAAISHAMWETQNKENLITVEAAENAFLEAGFKKLTKQEQQTYSELVFKMMELSGSTFQEEEPEPDPIEVDEELHVDQEDFALKPVKVPVKKPVGMRRTTPRKRR